MNKLSTTLEMCKKHTLRISHALSLMQNLLPINAHQYKELSETEIEHIDQFLFRFGKLQDQLGEKAFIQYLESIQEGHYKNRPFIDILNRLEQLGILNSKEDWIFLRTLRNQIAHEYEDEYEEMAITLNLMVEKVQILFDVLQRLEAQTT